MIVKSLRERLSIASSIWNGVDQKHFTTVPGDVGVIWKGSVQRSGNVCAPPTLGDLHIFYRKREPCTPSEYLGLCWGSYCTATASLRWSVFGQPQMKWSEKNKKAINQILKKLRRLFQKNCPLSWQMANTQLCPHHYNVSWNQYVLSDPSLSNAGL